MLRKISIIATGIVLTSMIILLLSTPYVNAIPATSWSKTYGGDNGDRAYSITKTVDGGYAMVGVTNSFSGDGLVNAWLVKTDADGNLQWNQTYSGLGTSIAGSIVQTTDGGYALAGYTYSVNDTIIITPWLVKTDSAGNLQWNETYTELGDIASSVIQTTDGGYALTGYSSQSDNTAYACLVKTDANGSLLWNKTYGGTGDDKIYTLVQNSDGYTLAGYTNSVSSDKNDFWLIRTDSSGNMQWNKTYGGTGDDTMNAFVQTSDGGYALIGSSDSYTITGTADFLLVKADSSGNLQWNKTYGESNVDDALSGIQTADGGYALAGVTATATGDLVKGWLVRTDAEGNMQWNQTYGESAQNVVSSIVQASDGGFVLAGYTNSSSAAEDFWLIKTDANGVVPEIPGLYVLPFLAVSGVFIAVLTRKTIARKNK